MKARRLIESSTLSPEPLRVAFQAFDAAWAEISSHFDGDERATQDARMKLAHAAHRNQRGRRRPCASQERRLAGDGVGVLEAGAPYLMLSDRLRSRSASARTCNFSRIVSGNCSFAEIGCSALIFIPNRSTNSRRSCSMMANHATAATFLLNV